MPSIRTGRQAQVVVAGGGIAALEAAVALRVLAEDRVRLTVISPDPHFRYRPRATLEAFGAASPVSYDLRALVTRLGGELHLDRLAMVDPKSRSLMLDSGVTLAYDVLILAPGAHSQSSIEGALTFRDQRDGPKLRRALEGVRSAQESRVAFAVPSRHSWPVAAYELALLAASHLEPTTEIIVVTPERSALESFGSQTSQLLTELLSQRGVGFVGGVTPRVARRGVLELEFEAPVRADVVVALPELRGERIPGIPASWLGFIPTNSAGRVESLTDVYAAGDATTFPIKHGGVAAQQADRVAQTIARDLGAPVHAIRAPLILQAQLLGGPSPVLLRTELDEFGQPVRDTVTHSERASADQRKVYARYLSPYLAEYDRIRPRTAA